MIIMLIILGLIIMFFVIGATNHFYYETWPIMAGSICAALFIILLVIIVFENVFPSYHKIRLEEKRSAIVYEMDHGFYVGDSLGEFNADLKSKQALHENPWTSWFVGHYVMEVAPIEPSE